MWWFWPFVVCIFLASFFFALRLVLGTAPERLDDDSGAVNPEGAADRRARRLVLGSFLPFLAYALVRVLQADVFMDAERSILLHLTPLLLGAQIVFGFSRRQRRLLAALIPLNLVLLALYAFVNHRLTGSRMVLWMPGYPQYYTENRVTGSYYCPDHFSGAMEIGVALGLALLLSRDVRRPLRLFGALLAAAGMAGVALSKSRGGGLVVLVLVAAALVWGFGQWPAVQRWCWRVSALALAVLVLALFVHHADAYMDRFASEFAWDRSRPQAWSELRPAMVRRLRHSSRGVMATAALRAWKEHPVWGIGPGMHQNVWPHIAAGPGGDRERRIWPRELNREWYSYEVHNDWLQLLEEYGAVGLALFLLPVSAVGWLLLRGLRRESDERRLAHWQGTGRNNHAAILGGLLACAALGVHSLGDFNLQIPGTNWMFAAVVALACAAATTAASGRRVAGRRGPDARPPQAAPDEWSHEA